MAIKRSFSGASIRKPGSYSVTRVDDRGGRDLGDNGILFILGEAELGAPGSSEGIQRFSSTQLSALVNKYGSGPIVDAARLAIQSPSNTPGIAGADEVLVWKTNQSTRASLTLENAGSDDVIVLRDAFWGALGNKISVQIANGTAATQKTITIKRSELTENLGQNPGLSQLSVEYTGAGTSCEVVISGATPSAKTLVTTCATAPADDLSISLNQFTMAELAEFINNQPNYTATLKDLVPSTVRSATELDNITIADILNSEEDLYRLQREIIDLINEDSQLVEAELAATLAEGLPANISANLAGGAKGASANSDFTAGLSKSLSETYNVAVPLVSRDATDDILSQETDAASTYTIAAVLAGLNTHLRQRGTTKNRKEAQGMAGFRSATKADWYERAQVLGSELVQLVGQDVLVQGLDGNLAWKQPHMLATLLAGIRLGSEVGEPLTFKFANVSGVGHAIDSATGLSDGDFDPDIDFDEAIDAGVTFLERAGGGFRVVVDNTTYGTDQSFVFNRGSVVEAAQFIAKSLREQTEQVFVGNKISAGQASSIKTFMRGLLLELKRREIITPSDDAPDGFKESTFSVTITGNTARVNVEVKPVQGLDFVLIDLTLGNIIQTA
jgi:hypothetical protein